MNRLTQTLIKAIPAEQRLQLEKQLAHKDLLISTLKKDVKEALRQASFLEMDKQALLGMQDAKNRAAWKKPKRVADGDACAILNLSDLHCEEVVKAETVNNINSYNPRTCEKRLDRVVERFVLLVDEHYRRTSKVEECVIWFGGDIISGQIHEELAENNAMSPINACVFGERLLDKSLTFIRKHGGFKKITVVGNSGNHDRDTKKTRAATRISHSYTTLIYEHLRARSAERKETDVHWLLADGAFAYLNILGTRVRFTHGDQVKYQGGLAGLSAPMNRAIHRWNAAVHADFTIAAHFHNFEWNRPNAWMINGSLIGTAPYGLSFGRSDPCQSLVVVTKKHGVVSVQPIFTD